MAIWSFLNREGRRQIIDLGFQIENENVESLPRSHNHQSSIINPKSDF
jgi:hypothetical protein